MNRKVLYLPLAIFLILAAALMWQLMRNSDGWWVNLCRISAWRHWKNRMSCWIPLTLSMVNRC